MTALNFQRGFVQAILHGIKKQTIRKVHKSRPICFGDDLYLYTGQRTANCVKLGEAICSEVSRIFIEKNYISLGHANHSSRPWCFDTFAQQDGFGDFDEMALWFETTYGLPFEGVLIKWDDFTPAATL